jgi:tetratricopeptide (TPR) repeat protein
VVCGIGSYAPELRETFQTYGLEECSAYYAPTRESISAIIQATDAMYLATLPSRDRIEGDPYRILMPMTYGIPVIAPRNPLIEEFCGKHRLDFCPYSPQSLAKALRKLRQSPGLVKDIVEKNLGEVKKRFDQSKIQNDMMEFFKRFAAADPKVDKSSLDYQVLEIEAKIKNKQYLDAIELIESVFQIKDVPLHHRANLYRLVGDCFAKLGDLESAKDAYLQGADLDPYSAKIYIGLGTVGLMKNTADTAVLQFQRAVSLAPEDEMANLGLGLSFQGMGEHREAWRWVKKALQLNPENTAAIFSFVKLAHELEEYSDCEAALQRFLERHPRDINMKYTLGGLVFKQDRFNEVIRLMDEILEQDENDNRALALRKQAKDAIDNEQASSSNG